MKHHIEQPPRFNVAVLYPSTNGPVREIVRGILAASESTDSENYLRCSYIVADEYDAHSPQATLKEALALNPQLIISVGFSLTKATVSYLAAHAPHTPLICTATDGLTISVTLDADKEKAQREARAKSKKPLLFADPVTMNHLHELITGYTGPALALERGDLDQQQLIRSLITLHPKARRILVPFINDENGKGQAAFTTLQRTAAMQPNPFWEEQEKELSAALSKAQDESDDEKYARLLAQFEAQRREEKKQRQEKSYCTLIPLPLTPDHTVPLEKALHDALKADKKINAVMTPEDFLLGDVSDTVSKICAQHDVLFFGSSITAVQRGAAAAFGGCYTALGAECFAVAYDHLVKKKNIRMQHSRHVAIPRELSCSITRCRDHRVPEQYLQNFLHLPDVTTIESL